MAGWSPRLYVAACVECKWESDSAYMELEEADREAEGHVCHAVS